MTYDFILKQRAIIERKKNRVDCLRIDKLDIQNVEVEEEGQKKTV